MDEVLAVGDAAFQKKLHLGQDAGGRRRLRAAPVLVVSHQLDVIHRLCKRAVWLDRGRIAAYGLAAEVVARYLSEAGLVAAPGADVGLSGDAGASSGDGAVRASCG